MKKNKLLVLLILIIIIFISVIFIILKQNNSLEINNNFIPENKLTSSTNAPSDLSLPFNINKIDANNGDINPIGVYRFSKDTKGRGHSGLDVPLIQGSNIYAVDDGEIILIELTGDPWGGMKMYQLLETTGEGEGWIFNYDHVTPTKNIIVGKKVKRGDLIATKTPPSGFTAHFEMSKIFNDFKFTKDNKCWPEMLKDEDNELINIWWEEYRTTESLISSWSSNQEEGKYPFRGLLDENKYPEGPALCYSPGTDVR